MREVGLEDCNCHYWQYGSKKPWASEKSLHIIQCVNCEFLYLSPRPNQSEQISLVYTWIFKVVDTIGVYCRYTLARASIYSSFFSMVFSGIWFLALNQSGGIGYVYTDIMRVGWAVTAPKAKGLQSSAQRTTHSRIFIQNRHRQTLWRFSGALR